MWGCVCACIHARPAHTIVRLVHYVFVYVFHNVQVLDPVNLICVQ